MTNALRAEAGKVAKKLDNMQREIDSLNDAKLRRGSKLSERLGISVDDLARIEELDELVKRFDEVVRG